MPSVCDCRGLTSHFHKHFHHNKLHGDGSVVAVCNCMDRQATYADTSTKISSLEVTLFLQSVVVVDRQATFTDTFIGISSMEIGLCLQSVAVVNRQATFTDTSTRISSMEIALYLQSVTVVD